MERVETLLKKLQDQVAANVSVEQLLLTVQMLQAELLHLKAANAPEINNDVIAVTVSQNSQVIGEPQPKTAAIIEVERTVEVLQVDEAELEAELEEIKRNAEAMQQISVQHKPYIVFEPEDDIPTLAHQEQPEKFAESAKTTKEINESATSGGLSLNERLKQSKIDLGDTLTEVPIRDLRKAIGVNDRFVFINELFRGDETVYERSIKTINSFSIYAEAEYWIERELKVKNGWDNSNDLVQQFYQLVKRRFS